jgi:serine/threonine-protein kinase
VQICATFHSIQSRGGAGSLTRDDPTAFAPPPAFGPFRVLHQIGVGALGPVFRTYEPTRDRLVAVKAFRLDITPEQARSLADRLSASADAGLFHPSIVEPIAAGVQGTVAYRAEEYVAAETLDVAMRHYAPAAPDKALPFLTQLAGAIDFARAAGVGHGALHPRDVFVTPEEARATGFGVVEALEAVGLRAPVRRPYAAPERIEGSAWGTPADVFSLAAIAYELLTGRRPAGPGPAIGTLSGSAAGEHEDALLAVLARAMDADPAQRYPSALAFAGSLEAAARGEHAAAVPAPVRAAAAPASVPAAAAVPAAREAVEDDVVAEQDEDDAYQELLLREQEQESARQSETIAGDEPEEPEAEADRLLVAAAAGASDDARGPVRDESPATDTDRGTGREAAVAPLADRSMFSDAEYRGGAVVPAQRSRLLPLAAMLSIGLLVGFAVGYGVASREPEPEAPPTVSQGPQAAPTAGRDYSEQAVAPPATPPRQQAAATPPPIPSETVAPSGAAPSAAPPPVAAAGRLVVRSTPARAGVTLNGVWSGRTPLTVDKLPFGQYAIRIVQPGYAVARENVMLSADEPARTLAIVLQRQTPAAAAPAGGTATPRARTAAPAAQPQASRTQGFTGSIYVDSRPRGARVFLDGRPVGVTPLTMADVRAGSHVVRLELEDHRPWTASRQVSAGQEERVTGSLERIR